MPINVDLLIAAPMLQDFIIDKDSTPMAGGTITCYQDNSRTTLKNWYYQSSNFADANGKYTFSPLPNPLTLSAAGTICDVNGVDTIPFFYPYSELDQTQHQPYYITIWNHDRTNEITRPNFPYNPQETNPDLEGSVDNYINNNVFWRNIGSANLTNTTQLTVAPSQHDGFRFPDIQFLKNVTGGQDTVTFTKFPLTSQPILTGDITPEYYINHTCSNSPTGETQKCYQFPISLHVNTLNGVQYTVTIQAQNVGGTNPGQNTINLFIFQDTGSGTTSPAPFLIGSITVNSAWTKYQFTAVFPTTAGLILSPGADDALYLQVQMPLDINCSINFTKPSIYLTNLAPTNSFQTYDEIDTVISSPRTGDIRTSLNQFYYFGWVPMNNGSVGNASSNATARANADAWPLFNLLWTLFSAYNNGVTNPLAQMYNSVGAFTAYGSSAISDFNANNSIVMTTTMGKVLLGTAPQNILQTTYETIFSTTNIGGRLVIVCINSVQFYNGMPIIFFNNAGSTLPAGVAVNTVYYVSNFTGTTFNVATTFANALVVTVLPFVNSGSGAPFVSSALSGSSTGEYAHSQSIFELATHSHGALPPTSSFIGGASPGTQGLAVGSGVAGVAITATAGSSNAANVTQPGYFMNLYIKL